MHVPPPKFVKPIAIYIVCRVIKPPDAVIRQVNYEIYSMQDYAFAAAELCQVNVYIVCRVIKPPDAAEHVSSSRNKQSDCLPEWRVWK